MELPIHILAFADDPKVCQLIQGILAEKGYCTLTVPNAAEAIACLKKETINLILLDLDLRITNRSEFICETKKFCPDIPIIVLAGKPDDYLMETSSRYGPVLLLTKPLNEKMLISAVTTALNGTLKKNHKSTSLCDRLEAQVRERTEELNNQLLFLQNLIDAIPSPIFYKDTHHRYKGCNTAFESLTGLSREVIVGKTVAEIAPQSPSDFFRQTERQLLSNSGKINYEATAVDNDGAAHHFIFNKASYPDVTGKIAGTVGVMVEITDKVATERDSQQAQKLEAIGQLAAGIAHEINTPIQYIGDNTRFLEDAFTDLNTAMAAYARLLGIVKAGPVPTETIADVEKAIEEADLSYLAAEIPAAIEQSLEGIQRVSKIVKAMRQFSHPGSDRKIEIDLNQALENTITVSRNEWKYVAEMETDLDVNLPAVPCFPGEINQVFLNLIINAAHAVREKTDNGRKGKGSIRVSTHLIDGNVQIRIADDGIGMPKSIHQRIFDPFFTTKPVGSGTGQGLAIVHAVVSEKHGGMIRFETQSGKGTVFIIDLPLERKDASEEKNEM